MIFESIPRAAAGGVLVGVAFALRLALQGHAEGVTGMAAGLMAGPAALRRERALFLAGMALAGAGLQASNAAIFGSEEGRPLAVFLVSGFLVGIGSRFASGCTSGHGVLGLARGSTRSLAAVLLFMLGAFVTVWLRGLGERT